METKLSDAKDVDEFGRLFLKKYAEPVPYWNDEIKKAYENKNWAIAKVFSIIQFWHSTSFCGSPARKREEEYFWTDLRKDFAQTIAQYENKHKLDWTKLLYAELKFTKSATPTVKSVKKRLMLLIDNNKITLNETLTRLKIFFMAFDLGAKFEERERVHWNKRLKRASVFKESLEHYVATSNDLSKSDRLQILEFLAVRPGALTLEPNGEENIPTPLILAKRKHVMALRFFLGHSRIHKAVDSLGKNVLHYLAQYSPFLPYLKNFTLDQLKKLISAGVTSSKTGIKECPLDLLRYPKGQYPKIYLQAIQTAIAEVRFGDLRAYEFPTRANLGTFGDYFFADLGLNMGTLIDKWETNAKNVRRNSKRELILPGDTAFAVHELPLELVHLICLESDYETRNSLFSVSKSIFALKTKFSNQMWDSLIKKEFPMNADYLTKGEEGYKDITSRYINWKKGSHDVRYITWGSTIPRVEPSLWYMDENWLTFQAEGNVKLWDCHNDRIHDFNIVKAGSTTGFTYVDSRPGEIPIVANFTIDGSEIYIYGSRTQKMLKDGGSLGRGGPFIEKIDTNRVFSGGLGNVWDIEKEQIIGQISLPPCILMKGSYNPLNQLIFTHFYDRNPDQDRNIIAVFDKNYQKVAQVTDFKGADIDHFCFVDEYTTVFSSNADQCSVLWDLRKPDLPREFAKHPVNKTFCSRYGLTSYAEQRQAVIWDLKTGLWEKSILLPEEVRYRPIGNSRYACWEMLRKPQFCLLDFQRI